MDISAKAQNSIRVLYAIWLAAAASVVWAVPYEFDLQFTSSEQSIWGAGTAEVGDDRFFGARWDEQGAVGGFTKGTGLRLSGETRGRLGLDGHYSFSGGGLDVDYPMRAVIAPQGPYYPGDTIEFNTWYTPAANAKLETTSPSFSATVAAVADIYATASARVCLVGRCVAPNKTLIDKKRTLTLADIDSASVATEVPVLPFGSIASHAPNLSAVSERSGVLLHTQTTSELVEARLDLQAMTGDLLGLASGTIPLGVGELDYTLYNVSGTPTVSAFQSLTFQPKPRLVLRIEQRLKPGMKPLTTRLTVPLGQRLAFETSPSMTSLTVYPEFRFNHVVTNDTRLLLDPDIDLEALELGFRSEAASATLGPIVDKHFGESSFALFSRSFSLPGLAAPAAVDPFKLAPAFSNREAYEDWLRGRAAFRQTAQQLLAQFDHIKGLSLGEALIDEIIIDQGPVSTQFGAITPAGFQPISPEDISCDEFGCNGFAYPQLAIAGGGAGFSLSTPGFPAQTVPEPSGFSLLAVGILLLARSRKQWR